MLSLSILLPLLSAIFGSLFNRCLGTRGLGIVLVTNMLITTCISYYLLDLTAFKGYVFMYSWGTWLDFMRGAAQWGLWLDSITALMCVTVTTVSVLVHIYSLYYMETDPYLRKFLTYLTLFTFFMLFLVGSGNLLQLFFGWEGVGICSYLLINFWYTRPQANKAALKAILMNRVGDAGLLLAIVLILIYFGSVDFQCIFGLLPFVPTLEFNFFSITVDLISIIAFLLLVAVMAKSAQVGLHTWLPDAMEGPTPVSALIHAATMVTAGIYLMIRSLPIFQCSPGVLYFAALIGGLTAFFAATVALFQHDLKKIIAYSTCSQLGYMVMACGLSHANLALFHLINHAFFKALFFLGAGVIIHCFGGEQDIRKMGGLRHAFPFGLATMSVAAAALAGFPFLAGFYSKDFILGSLLGVGTSMGNLLWLLGVGAAICTSLYSFSLIYFIFLGEPRGAVNQFLNLHGVPLLASAPMGILAIFSIISGFCLRDLLIGPGNLLDMTPLVHFFEINSISESVEWLPTWTKLTTFGAGLFGVLNYLYVELYGISIWLGTYFPNWISFYRFFYFRWYWDVVYNRFIAWPVYKFGLDGIYDATEKGGVEFFGPRFLVNLGRVIAGGIGSIQRGDLSFYLRWTVFSFLLTWELVPHYLHTWI